MIEVSKNRINYLNQWRKARRMEREIFRNCSSDDENLLSNSVAGDLLDLKIREFTEAVRIGDVRLLSDDLTEHATVPRYVAVLTSPKLGIVVCAPFSRYLVPATKDEWLTGLKSPCLKVLQLWNAQPCSVDCIAKSWKVATLDGMRLSRALMLYRHSVNHTFPAENDREDIGVAIVSEKDERNDYMAEEYAEFSPLFSSVAGMINRENNIFDRIIDMRISPVFNVAAFALAAEDARRNPFVRGAVEGSDVVVAIEYELDKNVLRVKLRNDEKAHDGWSVWATSDVDSRELGVIENGLLVVYDVDDTSLGMGLVFVSPDGKTIKQFVPHETDK